MCIKSVSRALQWFQRGEITSKWQCTTESTRNDRALLDYVHMNMYNWIIRKRLRVPIIRFHIILWFHIQRRFRSCLTFRLPNLGQPTTCTRKYHMNKTCQKIHHWIPARPKCHYKFLHNHMILHTNQLLAPYYHLQKKISSETKMSHSTLLLHTHALHAIINF